jgi:hypothetical protein
MKAYVSLHTSEPKSQLDHEVSYPGYKRQQVDYCEGFAREPLEVLFPETSESHQDAIKYIAIGTAEENEGLIHKVIHFMPYINLQAFERPKIVICDIIPFPEGLNPIAQVIYELVYRKYMTAEDMHPALYEVVNTELQRVGMPVIPCVRSGTSHMKSCFESLTELSEIFGNA